ncbi:MAG: hypothetical protein IT162_12005 [Bryobacterales bacterium]|nr:hypothetical protein [Bryobacterales bacterium]
MFFSSFLRRVLVGLAAAGAWLLATPPAAQGAVLVEIHFPVLERALSEQMFAQDGRRYVKGSKADKCSFAYLRKPKLGGWNGKLTIKARFTGRSALDVIGRCIGLGDDFDLTILAQPHYQSGKLRLKNVNVITEGKDSMYIRNVRLRLGQSLEREFTYPLDADAKRILEEPKPGAPFKQELRDFGIAAIEVTPQAVVLTLDFRLSVK